MADDWKVGDLALCVSLGAGGYDDPVDPVPPAIRVGSSYTVTGVFAGVHVNGDPGIGLKLKEAKPTLFGAAGFDANMFVKITPPEADEFDRETIDLMNGAPVGEPVA
ncbi:MAG: hypothetical protein ACTHNA_14265 [Sphingopyxis terrae]|uniref:hypothetical protein n=1 Tax=Sphingopyxis terrae TaxID=33052 RepID=UPI003F7E0097